MSARPTLTRRGFGKLALVGLPASTILAKWPTQVRAAEINSRIKGVQVGAITYSFNRLQGAAEAILQAYQTLGLGEMELMSNHAEALAGSPARGAGPQALADWRKAATAATFAPVKKRIQDAGIDLRLLCFNINRMATDETIDYGFNMAKWLGVKGMTTSTQVSMAKRLAPFAETHQMIVGFHGHDSVTQPDEVHNEASFEAVMAASKYFYANLDVGHYTAAGGDAVAFIKKHHARVTNLHFKDMKKGQSNSYVPFGTGDAPLKEVLLLVSKEKYDFPVNIEFEYQGDPMVEIPKCFSYIKDALK